MATKCRPLPPGQAGGDAPEHPEGCARFAASGALVLRLVVAFMTLARMVQALRHWITRGCVVHLMAVARGVLLLCGVGFWWLEPRTPILSTAAIATTWIETEERRIEREILGDLRRQVHSLHAEIAAMRAELRHSRPPES